MKADQTLKDYMLMILRSEGEVHRIAIQPETTAFVSPDGSVQALAVQDQTDRLRLYAIAANALGDKLYWALQECRTTNQVIKALATFRNDVTAETFSLIGQQSRTDSISTAVTARLLALSHHRYLVDSVLGRDIEWAAMSDD